MSSIMKFTLGDFSHNSLPKDTRWRLMPDDVEEGLIDNASGGVLRPSSALFDTRITTKNYIMLNEFDTITIPAGMQVCAVFYTDNGTYVGSGASWVQNTGATDATYDITSFSNNTGSNVVKCKISLGWVDSTSSNLHDLAPDDLITNKVYITPVVTEKRITSADITWGHISASGTATSSAFGRVCMDQSQKIAIDKFPYVTIPNDLMICVCYSRNGVYAGNIGIGKWTYPEGKIAVSAIEAQDYAAATTALGGAPTHYQLGFGRRTQQGETAIPLNGVEDFDTLYEVYISRE